jgi:hypothetical protein
MKSKAITSGKKAQHTAKWARTMTKWLITYTRRTGVRWNIVDFGGTTKAESRGIVDLLAIRKNHRDEKTGLKRGDLFDIILIQTKGGVSPRPIAEDISRLSKVAKYYKAKAVVLAEWRKGKQLELFVLKRKEWLPTAPNSIFG